MIEVALAMAIIAFGMTSILGLFPVGLNALRNSMAENFCAESVENIMGFMKNYAEYSPANYDHVFIDGTKSLYDNILPVTVIPGISGIYNTIKDIDETSPADIDDKIGISRKFIKWYLDSTHDLDTGDYRRVLPGVALPFFRPKDDLANLRFPFVYFIVKGADNANSRNMDFSAMVIIKKANVPVQKYATGDPDLDPWGDFPPPPYPAVADNIKYNDFGAIIFEVSWPLEVKYTEREKRYYYMVVSRPR